MVRVEKKKSVYEWNMASWFQWQSRELKLNRVMQNDYRARKMMTNNYSRNRFESHLEEY